MYVVMSGLSYVCTYVNYLGKLSKMYEHTSKKQDQLGI